jgi:hypothetical protein
VDVSIYLSQRADFPEHSSDEVTYLNRPSNPLRLASKPPREAQRIIQFPQTLGNRFTRLISDDLRQIILILSDQRIPFQQPLSTSSRIRFLERFKRYVGCLNSGIYIGCIIIGSAGPDFAAAGI